MPEETFANLDVSLAKLDLAVRLRKDANSNWIKCYPIFPYFSYFRYFCCNLDVGLYLAMDGCNELSYGMYENVW